MLSMSHLQHDVADVKSNVSATRWFCAQIGAREHYAIPRALYQTGRLAVLYTDFWAGPLTKTVARNTKLGALRSLASRWHPELQENAEIKKSESRKISTPHPGPLPERSGEGEEQKSKAEIVSWNLRALWWEVLRKRKTQNIKRKAESGNLKSDSEGRSGRGMENEAAGRHLTPDEAERAKPPAGASQFQLSAFSVSAFTPYHDFIEVGRRFATCVREDLKRRRDLGPNTIFYAYDTGALEAFEWCRGRGIKCVLNQMDPNRVEVELVRAEEKKWPGWAMQSLAVPVEYFARREREWALADRIVVNSEFSRSALLQQGVPPEKLVVIPLCFEREMEDGRSELGNGPSTNFHLPSPIPLRVLFLGQVILRKGIQYLMAAAKLLEKGKHSF